jgi:hypothetical protein
VIDSLRTTSNSFIVYITNFGITSTVSLPTISIILPSLTTPSALNTIARLKEVFDPFNVSAMLIRLSTGEFKRVGEVWYYERVHMASSISAGEDNTAGTVGGFCRDCVSGDTFGLTAAHVVGKENRDVFAPATKPFNEAIKSLEIRAKDEAKGGKDNKSWSQKLQDLENLDRFYGTSLFSSQKTTDDGRIIDCALVKVEESRTADNRVGKLPLFRHEFVEFRDDGDKIVPLTFPLQPGDRVWKCRIRTGLTKGTVMDKVMIQWDSENATANAEDEDGNPVGILCSSSGVLGEWDAAEGVYTDFALGGDSGSLLLRIVRDPEGTLESEAIVIRTEGAGLVYGIVWEEKYKSFVALYMDIDEVFRQIKEGTGLDVDFDVPDMEGEDWPYAVMGRGSSMYGLH